MAGHKHENGSEEHDGGTFEEDTSKEVLRTTFVTTWKWIVRTAIWRSNDHNNGNDQQWVTMIMKG
jgi:hypothetical protein